MTVLLTVVVVFTLCTSVCVAGATGEGEGIIESEIAQIINSQLSDEEKLILESNEPILKVYNEVYWSIADKPLSEVITGAEAYSEANNYKDYYVFSYVTSYEYNHDETGEFTFAGIKSFKAFINDKGSSVTKLSKTDGTVIESSLAKSNYRYLWLGISLLLVIGLTIGCGIYVKSKKNSRADNK